MMPLIQPSNRPHMARGLLVGVLLILSGCSDDPERVSYSTNSYASTPVIVEAVLLNGVDMNAGMPEVVVGSADREMPRNQGIVTWDYTAGPEPDGLILSARWVELLTRRAYRAEAAVPVADLYSPDKGNVIVTVIFGPNGQMVVGSDPIPTSADNRPKVDVADVCGQRFPEADFDYRTKANEIAGLTEALQFSYPPVENPKCSGDAL